MAQSLRFADDIKRVFGDIPVVISPLMAPRFLAPDLPAKKFTAVILASEAGADAARRISAAGVLVPKQAYCVGDRTAAAAVAAGFDVISAGGDAGDLKALIIAENPVGPLVFLRGQDSTGDVDADLNRAGIETISVIVYQQIAQSLTTNAIEILQQDKPVIVPLFSPRSAQIFQSQLRLHACTAPIWVAALSPAIAAALQPDLVKALKISRYPTAASMLTALGALMRVSDKS